MSVVSWSEDGQVKESGLYGRKIHIKRENGEAASKKAARFAM